LASDDEGLASDDEGLASDDEGLASDDEGLASDPDGCEDGEYDLDLEAMGIELSASSAPKRSGPSLVSIP
jgi:hypothetical protein